MFKDLVQIFAVLSAVPAVVLLLGVATLPIMSYQPGGLHLKLLSVLFEDIDTALREAVITPSEKTSMSHLLSDLSREFRTVSKEVSAGVDPLPKILLTLFETTGAAEEICTKLYVRRDEVHRRAVERYQARIETMSPMTAGRFRTLLISIEQARLVVYAVRHEGLVAANILLTRAGEDVTRGSVIGLVTGILGWYSSSRFQGDFVAAIGYGVTLGAFIGLIATSASFARKVAPLPSGNERKSWIWAISLSYSFIAAALVLTYLGPSWWPLSRR